MTLSIAIIGAGLAGLSCAVALREAGHHVSVFEKSRGAGGRLSTRRSEPWQADHGAQYFTARHPDFQREVQAWLQAGVAAEWPVVPVVLGGDRPPSHDAPVRYVGVPGMSAPAKRLAQGLDLHTSQTIQALERDGDGWRLRSAEQGLLPEVYSHVVVAIPAPQAAPLLAHACPPLSAAAAAQTMQPCWTVMAQFAAPVSLGFEAAFVNAGPLRWLARDRSKPGRSGQECWVLQANAQWSVAHLEDDAQQVGRRLLAAFGELGAPAPQSFTVHRWRYADCHAGNLGSAWDPERGIGLCGDWLHGGKVQGAWLSGRHLARQVLQGVQAANSCARTGTPSINCPNESVQVGQSPGTALRAR
ncbi:NAD(P)/FAD-dependent oxidoreductase [Bordetella sp. FB-8]|uniref:NAD(P)/FAD-dependent oxidoreductase n=1 Tax=Bordetella sp. FB-8 TaxID=1159870 RepID=UPI00037DB2FA|nr:FAD-dependent oxidoreductase [Bordetella sp. FB-8]